MNKMREELSNKRVRSYRTRQSDKDTLAKLIIQGVRRGSVKQMTMNRVRRDKEKIASVS